MGYSHVAARVSCDNTKLNNFRDDLGFHSDIAYCLVHHITDRYTSPGKLCAISFYQPFLIQQLIPNSYELSICQENFNSQKIDLVLAIISITIKGQVSKSIYKGYISSFIYKQFCTLH